RASACCAPARNAPLTSSPWTVTTRACPSSTAPPCPPGISAGGRGVGKPPATSGQSGTTRPSACQRCSRPGWPLPRPSEPTGWPSRHALTRTFGRSERIVATAAEPAGQRQALTPGRQDFVGDVAGEEHHQAPGLRLHVVHHLVGEEHAQLATVLGLPVFVEVEDRRNG